MKMKSLALYMIFFSFGIIAPCLGQATWDKLADHRLGQIARCFSFELEGILYVGCGQESDGKNRTEIWAYDVVIDTWSQKSNFPGIARRNAFAFQAGGFGYMGAGFDTRSRSDFWKYNPKDDTWTELPAFPGGTRIFSEAVSAGNKAYVLGGLEETYSSARKGSKLNYFSDLWEFDSQTESWTKLEGFPGRGRWLAYSWIIDQKLYIGGGSQWEKGIFDDLYAYDLITGEWEDKNSCPSVVTEGAFAFTIHGLGYIVEASMAMDSYAESKTYVYDPIEDTWTEGPTFPGYGRAMGFCTVIGDKAILGTGLNFKKTIYFKDIYSFTP